MSEKVKIFDTTLRDGEQVPGCQLNTIEKIEIAKALEALGVDVVEAGFPISVGRLQLGGRDIESYQNPTICALPALKRYRSGRRSASACHKEKDSRGIGTSPFHIQYKIKTTPEEIIRRLVTVKYARKFVDDVEFYAEDAEERTMNTGPCH